MKNRIKWIVVGAIAATVALVLAGTALAQGYPRPTTNGNTTTYEDGWEEYLAACHGGTSGTAYLDGVTLKRVADLLQTTVADLQAQLRDGTSLKEIAESKGVSLETLIDTILAPHADMLASQVKYGYLTQEDANTLLERERDRLTYSLSGTPGSTQGTTPGQGWGMMGGYGMMGGMMGNMMGGYGGYGSGMMGGFNGSNRGSTGGFGGFGSGMMGGFYR